MSGVPWHITIERSGGFAGLPPRTFDSATLDAANAAKLGRLADAVDFSRQHSAGPSLPDEFQYQIVAKRGSEGHELTLPESQLDPPLRELVQWLMEQAPSPKQ
jgi:hypothetical protein